MKKYTKKEIVDVRVTGITATETKTNTIRWDDDPRVPCWNIYRGIGTAQEMKYAMNIHGNKFIDANLDPNKIYFYRIAAAVKGGSTNGGEGYWSDEVSA